MSNLPVDTALNETSVAAAAASTAAAEEENEIVQVRNGIELKRVPSSGGGQDVQLEQVVANDIVEPDCQVKKVNAEDVFGDQFDYTDYLFDANSNSVCDELQSEQSQQSTGNTSATILTQQTASSLASLSLASTTSPTDQILNFDIDQTSHSHHAHAHHHLHYNAHHSSQNEADYVPSSIVTSSDNSSTNDYLLFDTSMLDTATELSDMPETSPTASSANTKVVDYYSSSMQPPSLSQSSSTLTNPMSQQMSLDSHHHQSQQQQQQAHHNQPMLDSGYVQYHRMNGNGNHGGTQVVNDSNNNPVVDMGDDLKNNMNTMLTGDLSLVDHGITDTNCSTDNTNMDRLGSDRLSQNSNQYVTSNVGQMMDNSTTVNSSTTSNQINANQVLMMDGVQHTPTTQHQPHHMETHGMPHHQAQSNAEDNLLNIIPNQYDCLLSDQSDMHLSDPCSNTESITSQQSAQQQHQQQQQQQQQQSSQTSQSQSCMSDDTSLYHTHHLQHQMQSTSQHHSVMTQNTMSGSMQDTANQMNHLHHQQQQQQQSSQHQHHYHQTSSQTTHHHQIVANAQSTPTMEYGQAAQLQKLGDTTTNTTTTSTIDSSSNNSLVVANMQQQQTQSANPVSSSSTNRVPDNILSQPPTPVSSELKPDNSSYVVPNAGNDYMQQYHQTMQQNDGQLVNVSSTSGTSTLLSSANSSTNSMLLHSLTNTAHQRTSHYMANSNTLPSNNGGNQQPDATSTNSSTANNVQINNLANTNININTSSSNNTNPNNSTANNGANTASTANNTNENVNNSVNNAGNQLMNQFNATPIDSASISSSSSNLNPNLYALVEHDQQQQSQHQTASGNYQEQPKTSNVLHSMSQEQFDVVNAQTQQQQQQQQQQTQRQLQTSSVSLNNTNTAPVNVNLNVDANSVHVPQHPLGSVAQQQTRTETSQSKTQSGYTTTPTSQICMVTLPNNLISANNNQNNSGNNMGNLSEVSTVTLAPMPTSTSHGDLRQLCVIADPNAVTLPPLHSASEQAQQMNYHLLQPKIRLTTNISGNNPLFFASKTTPQNHQTLLQHQSPQADVVQAMIVPSNFNQSSQLTNQPGNVFVTAGGIQTSSSNLHNMDNKHFVPISGNIEPNYHTSDIMLTRQYSSSSMQNSSLVSSASISSSSSAGGQYHTSVANSSSIPSGSQYGQVQNTPTTPVTAAVNPQLLFGNTPSAATNIRILDQCSIVALQPASLQSSQNSKSVSHKIFVHSMPNNVGVGNSSGAYSPTTPTLISLNHKTLALNANLANSTIGHLQVSSHPATSQNNSLVNNNIPSGSIIFNIQNPDQNIPGAHGNRSVTNFAVPIPVVTSTVGNVNPVASNTIVTRNALPTGQFTLNTGAFTQNVSQPTILSNPVPHAGIGGGGMQVVALATKSSKLPPSTANKTASKSVAAVAASGSSSASNNTNTPTDASITSGQNLNLAPLMSGDPAKPFKCRLCGRHLASKNVYQLHLRSHSGEKPFDCKICSNKFSQKTSLTRHMRSHTGERPYPCEVCKKRFADKERIKIHMRIHTGEKPFTCEICSKRFSQKSTVKRHMSVHTGVKPFKCEKCGKGFANRGNLTAHQKTHQQNHHSQQQARNNAQTATITEQHSLGNSLSMPVSNYNTSVSAANSNNNNESVKIEVKMEIDESINDVTNNTNNTLTRQQHNQFTSATAIQQHQQQQPQPSASISTPSQHQPQQPPSSSTTSSSSSTTVANPPMNS